MNGNKPWYLSVGVLGGILAALGPILTKAFGIELVQDGLAESVVGVIGGVLAVYGRIRAKKSIT